MAHHDINEPTLQQMLKEENVPEFYCNGVRVAITARDSIIFLYWNDKLRARINVSHITAGKLANIILEGLQNVPEDVQNKS